MKKDNKKLIEFIEYHLREKRIEGGVMSTIDGNIEVIYSIGTPKEFTDKAINEAIKEFNSLKESEDA